MTMDILVGWVPNFTAIHDWIETAHISLVFLLRSLGPADLIVFESLYVYLLLAI